MKTLLVIRHGKSLHHDYVFSDFQRHLNGKGYEEAREAALWLTNQGFTPDLLVTSPAIRAFTTAVVVAQYIGYAPGDIILQEAIYEASVNTLMYVLQSLPDTADTVAIFGHNPGFTELVQALAPNSIEHIQTAGVAALELKITKWNEVALNCGRLEARN
jgi:phosphohistidine phosphatase